MGNEAVNNVKKEKLNIPVMVVTIVGIVLIVFGFLLVKNNNFKLQVISSEGIVTAVQTSNDSNGVVVNKTLSVTYNANGGDYTASIGDLNSTLQIGDKKTLYYDFFDPASVSDKRAGYQGYIALIFGLIFVLNNGPKFWRIVRDNYLS